MWSIILKHVFRDKEVMVVRPRDRKCRRGVDDDVTQLDRGHRSAIRELMIGNRILDSLCSWNYSPENNRQISSTQSVVGKRTILIDLRLTNAILELREPSHTHLISGSPAVAFASRLLLVYIDLSPSLSPSHSLLCSPHLVPHLCSVRYPATFSISHCRSFLPR
jgi:hypothetical protein